MPKRRNWLMAKLRNRVGGMTILRPNFFRQTPFRLTLVFLFVYVFAAALVFTYVYLATSAEMRSASKGVIDYRIEAMRTVNAQSGHAALMAKIHSDDAVDWITAMGAFDPSGKILTQNSRARLSEGDLEARILTPEVRDDLAAGKAVIPVSFFSLRPSSTSDGDKFGRCCRYEGRIERIDPATYVYVVQDMSWVDRGFHQEFKAVISGGVLVLVLGLFAGTLINQEVSRSVQRVTSVLTQVQDGDLKARIAVRESGDEFDALSLRINQTLERMEKTVGNLKYAGDAIAHDLRSPLSRLRTNLEVGLLDIGREGKNAPDIAREALTKTLAETDQLLRTFQTVLAMSRLQAQGQAPDQILFSATELATDMAELFEVVATDKGLEFTADIESDVRAYGNRDFLAQALSNLLDNAIKYTPLGGRITFRLCYTTGRDIEFSICDTGPGVPENDRARITERFVRLESSRSLPGVGLGLAMVEAVATAHNGHLEITDGIGSAGDEGPGLCTALILPPITV
ncbi:MAG: HAMP domain-containing sensor histidine kinase [Asticcacaulis sp.]